MLPVSINSLSSSFTPKFKSTLLEHLATTIYLWSIYKRFSLIEKQVHPVDLPVRIPYIPVVGFNVACVDLDTTKDMVQVYVYLR